MSADTADSMNGEALDRSYDPKVLRKTDDCLLLEEISNESKVLVLYSGGTIGMIKDDKNGKPSFLAILAAKPLPTFFFLLHSELLLQNANV